VTPDELLKMQAELGLSDGKMAQALGVTRQTWRNWRRGCRCPLFAQNALRWMMELRRISPANDNLPAKIKALAVVAVALFSGEIAA
jgi:DNA-binding transcriptional regulator YiaG